MKKLIFPIIFILLLQCFVAIPTPISADTTSTGKWISPTAYQTSVGHVTIYSGSMAFYDTSTGTYKPIDTDILSGDTSYVNNQGIYTVDFYKTLTSSCLIKVSRDDSSICWAPTATGYIDSNGFKTQVIRTFNTSATIIVSKNVITYRQAFGRGIDLQFIVGTDSLEEYLLISHTIVLALPAPSTYGMSASTTYVGMVSSYQVVNITPSDSLIGVIVNDYSTTNPISFKNTNGLVKFTLPSTYAWDSNKSTTVRNVLLKTGGLKLATGVPYSWILTTQGLVTIDPTVTIQPPTADTYIRSASDTVNYGTALNTNTESYNSGADKSHSLYLFDIAGNVPAGSAVTSATISVNIYANTIIGTFQLHHITGSWTETGATWLKYNGVNTWVTAGGDYNTTAEDTQTPAGNGWFNMDATYSVKSVMSGYYTDSGFLERSTVENNAGDNYFYAHSREYATDTSLRPKLSVTYSTASATLNLKILSSDTSTLVSAITTKAWISMNNGSIYKRQVTNGWVNFTGQSAASTVISLQIFNTTATNSFTKVNSSNTVTITTIGTYKIIATSLTTGAVFKYKRDDHSLFTPTSMSITFGNNGTTISNTSGGSFINGTFTVNSITWSNNNVKNATSSYATPTTNSKTLSFYTQIYRISYIFRKADATSIVPTSLIVRAPNSTLITLNSYSTIYEQNGTWTPTSINYWSNNIRKNTTDTYNPSADATYQYNTRIYRVSYIFRKGDTTGVTPQDIIITAPNSTILTYTTYSSKYQQNGTWLPSQINWQTNNVRKNTTDSYSLTTDSSTYQYNLNIYRISYIFHKADGTSINPTNLKITAPNGTLLTLTNYIYKYEQNGTYTPSQINLWSNNIRKNTTDTYNPTIDASTYQYNVRIYTTTYIFRKDDMTAANPANIKIYAPNSTLMTYSTFTGIYQQNGSYTPSQINWENSNVIKNNTGSYSLTTTSTYQYNLRIYTITPSFLMTTTNPVTTNIQYNITITGTNTSKIWFSGVSPFIIQNCSYSIRVWWHGIQVYDSTYSVTSTTTMTINTQVGEDASAKTRFAQGTSIHNTYSMLIEGIDAAYQIQPDNTVINGTVYTHLSIQWNYTAGINILNMTVTNMHPHTTLSLISINLATKQVSFTTTGSGSTTYIISYTAVTYVYTLTVSYTGYYNWYANAPFQFPDLTYLYNNITLTLPLRNYPQTIFIDLNTGWTVANPFFGDNDFWTPAPHSGIVIGNSTVIINYTAKPPCSESSVIANLEQGCIGTSTIGAFGSSLGTPWLFVFLDVIIFVAIFAKSNNVFLSASIFVIGLVLTMAIIPQSIISIGALALIVSATMVIVRIFRRTGA